MIDLYPTFLELAENEVDRNVFGQSLTDILTEGKSVDERAIISQLGVSRGIGASAMVKKGDYKLIAYSDIGENQLFNLQDDPDETRNLVNEGYDELIDELEYILYANWNPQKMNEDCKAANQNKKIFKDWCSNVKIDLENRWSCDKDKNYLL